MFGRTDTVAATSGDHSFTQLNGGTAPNGESYDFSGVTLLKLPAKVSFLEGTAPTGASGYDVCHGDSSLHALEWSFNNGGFHILAETGFDLSGAGTQVVSALFSGATSNTLSKFNSTGNVVNSGILDNGTRVRTPEGVDFTGASITKLRVGAGLTSSSSGDLGYDTMNDNWRAYQNEVDSYLFGGPASAIYTNGDCPEFSVACGVITLADTGLPCGTSGGNTSSSTMASGIIPQATGANSIGDSSPQLDNGATAANTLTCAGSGGIAVPNGGVTTGSAGASSCGSATGCIALSEGITVPSGVSGVEIIRADATQHTFQSQVNGGSPGTIEIVQPGAVHSTANSTALSTATLCAASAGACGQAGQYNTTYTGTSSRAGPPVRHREAAALNS